MDGFQNGVAAALGHGMEVFNNGAALPLDFGASPKSERDTLEPQFVSKSEVGLELVVRPR